MEWTRLAGECNRDDCPTIYLTERGTVAVQGPGLEPAGGVLPSLGELIVEVPLNLLMEAASAAR